MDIASRLDIPTPNVMRTPFYRPMLRLGAMRAPDDTIERTHLLAELLGSHGQDRGAAVVYVTLQKTAEEVSQMLVAAGFDARPYHAGLPSTQREVRSWCEYDRSLRLESPSTAPGPISQDFMEDVRCSLMFSGMLVSFAG